MSAAPDTLVSFSGEEFVTTSLAASETNYAQDYIASLARDGKIPARQVNGLWYVDLEALRSYKKEAATVPSHVESMGMSVPIHLIAKKESARAESSEGGGDHLFPVINKVHLVPSPISMKELEVPVPVPVKRYAYASRMQPPASERAQEPIPWSRSLSPYLGLSLPMIAGSALTVVVVLSMGIATLKSQSVYAAKTETKTGLTASVGAMVTSLGDMLEQKFVPEIIYTRKN